MNEREILECVHCGGEDFRVQASVRGGWYVECQNYNCGARGPICADSFLDGKRPRSGSAAIAAWNAAPRVGTCADVAREGNEEER